MPIQRFLFTHICCYRPNKKTFHILEWCEAKRIWFPYTGTIHPSDIRIRKSILHTQEEVNIPIRLRQIKMRSNGQYLRIAPYEGRTVSEIIPICTKKPSDTYPPSLLKYPTPYPTLTDIFTTTRTLWNSFAPVEPVEPIPPVAPVAPTLKASIPARIAYILAKQAEINGDTCPISLDTIVAENAHVTSCFHIFQGGSIQKWLTNNSSCPVCNERCTSSPTVN